MEAFHNAVTAVLTIRGAAKAVAFYKQAFDTGSLPEHLSGRHPGG